MNAGGTTEQNIQAEIERLRGVYPNTQELYREACVLLFFRFGITPTANKLYQFVRKGSMSAPAEALAKFWQDLREKSRVRIEHPDLPDDLKAAAGELTASLWTKAQAMANETLAAHRADAQAAAAEAAAAKARAEAERDDSVRALHAAQDALRASNEQARALEQRLAAEYATRIAVEGQIDQARQEIGRLQAAQDEVRREFSLELDKLRATAGLAEERFKAAEERALMEIDRERTQSARLQKELDAARSGAAAAIERHRREAHALQDDLGNLRQRLGHIEGELQAVGAMREQLANELAQERATGRDLAARLVSAGREIETWRQKAIDAHREVEALRAARRKKREKDARSQLDLGEATES